MLDSAWRALVPVWLSVVSTSAIDCLERPVPEMTVLSGTSNSLTYSLTANVMLHAVELGGGVRTRRSLNVVRRRPAQSSVAC